MAPSAQPVRASPPALASLVLGPGAALAAWASLIVVLNVTASPGVVAVSYGGLAALALSIGARRLIVISWLVGLALIVVVPGVALVDGSWKFAYADGAWAHPTTASGWARVVCSSLRVPAQVLATVVLMVVPARLVLEATSRISPKTALLGGLVSRMRPLLVRDLRLVREELESRGVQMGRGASMARRVRGAAALWEAAMAGLLDRAFATAAALQTRGYGEAVPTSGPLPDPALDDGIRNSRSHDALIGALAVGLVAVVVWGRASGQLLAPPFQALGQTPESVTAPASLVAALLTAWLCVLIRRAPRAPSARAQRPTSSRPAPTAPTTAALSVEQVSMRYPASAHDSLLEASMGVQPGELVVVTGASGSGKSTLLDVVTGVAPRTTGGTRTGTVRLGTFVLDGTRRGQGARIAAVAQDPESQVLVGIVAEEIAFGPRHAGLPLDEVANRVGDALVRLDLTHLAQRDCATLSGGELQRVLLAAALAMQPSLLVLDEPTSQVDAVSERRFWDAVDAARRDLGIAVLVAEHRLDHVAQRADRILVFAGGRIVAEATPATIGAVAPGVLEDAYRDLVPAPAATDFPPRLNVRFDRVQVGAGAHGTRTLLRGFSASLPARSVVTLEGPNGTGKSTVLRAIRGLHPAPGGVLIDGVRRGDVGGSVRQIAFLSQGAGAMVPGRTVRHAAEETCTRLGVDPRPALVALAAARLDDRAGSHPSELSVGERQRLALVAATAHRPPVWLLDEPTRGMDAAARRWVACHILAHAASGGVVLVATHDSALAAAIATHRLRLDVRTGPSLIEVRRDAAGRLVPSDQHHRAPQHEQGGVR